MLKIFLVEDEVVVREGLRDSIPWAQYGYQFEGEATDGETALPQIREKKPDVLITDIKMPFMDGLALSRLVSEEFPETKIILISGHEDFEFAQEAISIGIEQYLLKPITRATLLETLDTVRKKIEDERAQKEYLRQFQAEAQEYEQYARRKFFEQIASGVLPVQDIYSRAKELNIDIDAPCYNTVLLTFAAEENAAAYSQTIAELLERLMEYFLRYPEFLVFRYNQMTYAVLIKGTEQNIHELSSRCAENIRRRCDAGGPNVSWHVAISSPVQRLSGLPKCFAEANHILSYRHLMPQKHILTKGLVAGKKNAESAVSLDKLDASKADPTLLRNFLQTGLRDEIDDFVSEYVDSLGEMINVTMFRQYIMLNARFTATIAAQSFGCTQEDYLSALSYKGLLDKDIGKEELKAYISELLLHAILLREKKSGGQHKAILKKATKFIDENYTDANISLNTVAQAINISTNYFSGIFSQEMGLTFVEYLTNKRMEKAKLLLRQTGMRSGEVAFEVGYRDPRYFSFMFRKTQGCTPSNYRNGESSKHDY